MYSNYARPKWWQVYLTFPLLIALFMLDHRLNLSASGHQVVQIGILVVVFGLIHLWLKANATALSKMDQRQFHGTVTVIRVPPYQLPDTNNGKRPMFQLPVSELKGTLGNTFEMDYVDAEIIPIAEVPQEKKKE
jgi:hypothetical protein